ncbi:MAG: citrate synthase [Oscillospiraceae bacterium]|jgi:citrate synthase|nr:citrate synthase [Oscillospiraceae bacterium]
MRQALSDMCAQMESAYTIPPEQFEHESVKRGLRNSDGTGVIAGVTRIGSVRGYHMEDGVPIPADGRLYYRGINVMDIVQAHREAGTFGFEEVSYLLLLGRLPNADQYASFKSLIENGRKLPDGFFEDMILKAPSQNVMNKLSRAVLALYSYDPDPDNLSSENLVRQSVELIARLPVIIADAYAVKRHYYDNRSLLVHTPTQGSVAENFLHMLRPDNCFTREEALLLDLMLILHAEHGGGNNSAFTCRVLASTATDTYGCIAGAINSLKGPLHGGANQKVMEMFRDVHANVLDPTDEDEIYRYLCKIRDREAGDRSGKIYGLGHAVYTLSDPRALMLKQCVASLARKTAQTNAFQLMERIERQGTRALYAKLGTKKRVCANVDMYSGLVYQMLGIPEELFTPLFAIARIAGWCAHRVEEALTGNRIIRPAYRAMMDKTKYTAMRDREG